jgi:hypothetical protein
MLFTSLGGGGGGGGGGGRRRGGEEKDLLIARRKTKLFQREFVVYKQEALGLNPGGFSTF